MFTQRCFFKYQRHNIHSCVHSCHECLLSTCDVSDTALSPRTQHGMKHNSLPSWGFCSCGRRQSLLYDDGTEQKLEKGSVCGGGYCINLDER